MNQEEEVLKKLIRKREKDALRQKKMRNDAKKRLIMRERSKLALRLKRKDEEYRRKERERNREYSRRRRADEEYRKRERERNREYIRQKRANKDYREREKERRWIQRCLGKRKSEKCQQSEIPKTNQFHQQITPVKNEPKLNQDNDGRIQCPNMNSYITHKECMLNNYQNNQLIINPEYPHQNFYQFPDAKRITLKPTVINVSNQPLSHDMQITIETDDRIRRSEDGQYQRKSKLKKKDDFRGHMCMFNFSDWIVG